MGVLSHQPSGDWRNAWALTGSGVAAAWQALSVADDTKYVSSPASKSDVTVQFPVDITTIPDGAVITAATVKIRCSTGAGSPPAGVTPSVTVATAAQDDTSQYTTRTIYPTGSPTTFSVATYTRDALGENWDIERVNKLLARVFSYGGVADLVRVHQLYVDFTYRLRPTLTVDGPSGTVYTSSPTINWTYAHPDGDQMGGLHYRLFTAADVANTAFDPNTWPAVFEDHLVGDLASVILPTSINPNDYWIFARGVSIFGAIGQWISRLFSILGPAPCPPGVPDPTGTKPPGMGVIEVVPDSQLGSATLSLQDTSNLLSVQTADAETTTDEHACTLTNTAMLRDTTTRFPGGIGSWKLTAAGAGDMTVLTDWIEISAQGSGTVTARAQFRTAATGRSARCRILFYDTNFTLLSGTITGISITDSTSTWTEAVATGAVPATAAYARAAFDVLSAAASEIHNIDRLSLSYGTLSPWSDGGHMSRNLLSSWYSTTEGAPGAGESWVAGTASTTAVSSSPPGTGLSGSKANSMTYAGLTPTIAFRAAGTVFSSPTSGTDYTLNKPAGIVSGDLMLAFVSASVQTTITPPAGWQLVDQARVGGTSDTSLFVLKRTAGGSEPASWTTGVIGAAASRRTALVTSYSGAADAAMQFIAESAASTGNSTPLYLTTPTVANTDPNAWRVSAFAVSDNAAPGTLTANQAVPSAVPPIAFVSTATPWGQANSSNAYTINRPSGIQTGDLMIATFHGIGNLTVSPPAGWAIQFQGVGTGGPSTHAVLTRIAGASEPASWSASTSGTPGRVSVTDCAAYRNVNASTPFIAQSGALINNATTFPTPSVTNNNSGAWRVCSFGAATSTDSGSWTENDTIERFDGRAGYVGGLFGGQTQSVTIAGTDSNGSISTGSYTRTGTFDESGYSGAAWIGLLNPLASAPAGVPNETSRTSANVGSSNPWTTTGVFDSAGVVATGNMSVTGSWAPGSGTDLNSMAGWVGLIKPAAPVVAGYVSAVMATTVDVSSADRFDEKVTVTASFIGSAGGTPYLTVYFYRANVLLSSRVAQGTSFGTATWMKSAATFDLPAGTTRMKVGVSVSDRSVSDVVYFDRVSLAYGRQSVFRPGTSRGARPVWSKPQVQFADDDGSGYTDWRDLPGVVTNNPVFDPLSGVIRYTDHTVTPLVNRKYRARTVSHGLAGDLFVSDWGPDSSEFSFTAENWWLKSIDALIDNVQLYVKYDVVSVATNNTAAIFQPLGADRPVVLTEGYKTDTFSLTLIPVRRDDWASLKKLLKSGKTLFLQSDTDMAWWVRPVGDLAADVLPTADRKSDPVRSVKVTFIEVDPIP